MAAGPRVYLFDKEAGISTFDLIRKHKKFISQKKEKIGHFGTLDPFATGLVIIGVGGATRLNEYVHQALPKTYYAKGKIGVRTSTADRTGEIIEKKDFEQSFSKQEFESLVKKKFLGIYQQRPHAYSATKKDGKELYKYANEGIIIEKPPVEREIFSLEVISLFGDEIEFSCTCSSGTYIRVLFEDMLNEVFGEPIGHLLELRRTAYGHINLDDCLLSKEGDYSFMSLDKLLPLNVKVLSRERISAFRNGLSTNIDQVLQELEGTVSIDNHIWV
ncbi:MAG: tRNA pseudouridine(55) synthase TruB, partial [Bdellovibrionales bacterium]|nr:tRNA pseudouridine(55) synthase TruB [Bdellovibrionales bacterium]